ncbi:MAG: hypothetical protein AAF907_02920, partial [Planctomycetota bacterium]
MDRPCSYRRLAAALPIAALLTLGGVSAVAREDPVGAAEKAEEAAVSMRFFNAPWPAVLRKIAEESGSHLVMKDIPPGRFSRFDRGAYTRSEAVKMLNRRLEPDGFRILEQGENLIVLSDRSVRQNYRRPIAPHSEGRPLYDPATAQTPLPTPEPRRRNFGSVLPAGPERPIGPTARDAARRYDRSRIQQVGGTMPVDPAPAPPSLAEVVAREDAAPPRTLTVRVSRGNAKNVARTLMRAAGDRVKLVDRGPGGFPAFAAYRTSVADVADPQGPPAYSVGVNEAQDELVVTAPGERAQQIVDVLRAIDR